MKLMQDLSRLTVAILAGGLGTRLRPLISDRPKVLAKVLGRPFLSYVLDQLTNAGFKNVVLCTGYLGKQVRDEFGDEYGPLRLVYSQESTPLGTAGALRLALPFFESDSVLVMNGDSFCNANLKAFWSMHVGKDADGSIIIKRMSDTRRYGRVLIDTDGFILSFKEKHTKAGPGWINAAIYLFKKDLLETIPANQVVSLERNMLSNWVSRNLYGYKSEGHFIDIGIPDTYVVADRFFTEEYL